MARCGRNGPVPASWEDCAVYIFGDFGTEARVIEFADDKK